MRTAVLTVSTSVANRLTEDRSGPVLAGLAEQAGCEIVGGLDPCAIDRDPKGHLEIERIGFTDASLVEPANAFIIPPPGESKGNALVFIVDA